MRIFKKVVIDMASGGISQRESEWTDDYQGPICELKGGGGGTEPDYAYNAGMLKISEKQQAMADEMFNLFKYGVTYNPTEKIHGGGKVINPEWDAWNKKRKAQATKQGGMLWGDRMKENVGDPPPEKWIDDPDDWVLAGEQQGYDPDAVVSEMSHRLSYSPTKKKVRRLV
jgi:hypothetical protein